MVEISLLENDVVAAQATGDFAPVWKRLVATSLYVLITPQHPAEPHEGFVLDVRPFGPDQEPTVFASEDLLLLSAPGSTKATRMTGQELVNMLPQKLGLAVVLQNDVLGLPAALVSSLHTGLSNAV